MLTVGFTSIATKGCRAARVLVGPLDASPVAVRVVAGRALAHRNRRSRYSTWIIGKHNVGARCKWEADRGSYGGRSDEHPKHASPCVVGVNTSKA